jgi:hypothetical protein
MAKAMALSQDQIASLVISTLTAGEKRSSVVYLDDQSLPAGAELKVDGQNVDVPWAAVVAFVDLQPEMNWGHDCRYVLVGLETGELKVINAHLPPFLRGVSDTLRVIWQGDEVPEWTLVC